MRAAIRGGAKLTPKVRTSIGRAFKQAGLDGNGRFPKPEAGFSKAVEILRDYGIELDDIPHSHLFAMRPDGQMNLRLALSNPEDPHSPTPIGNSMLVLTFHEMEEYKFEVLAYVS
jgi:hypothetical protein